MVDKIRISVQGLASIGIGAWLIALVILVSPAAALTQIPTPDPKPGSYGIEATKLQAPPKRGATISTPGNGSSFSKSPISVNGICPTGLLVEVYNNGVMVGSVMCKGGSFRMDVSLFVGKNELTAIVYDDLGQAGPESKIATVNYSNTDFSAFGEQVTLTSSYGRRSAPAGDGLRWPLQLSGGSGPYAFSIDWGDTAKPELKSQSGAGVVTIAHAYKTAGIYQVNVSATDNNGVTAFLQVVAVSSGKVDSSTTGGTGKNDEQTTKKAEILWIPAAVSALMLPPAFWFGRRSQLVSLRNKMLKERDSYEEEQKKK